MLGRVLSILAKKKTETPPEGFLATWKFAYLMTDVLFGGRHQGGLLRGGRKAESVVGIFEEPLSS